MADEIRIDLGTNVQEIYQQINRTLNSLIGDVTRTNQRLASSPGGVDFMGQAADRLGATLTRAVRSIRDLGREFNAALSGDQFQRPGTGAQFRSQVSTLLAREARDFQANLQTLVRQAGVEVDEAMPVVRTLSQTLIDSLRLVYNQVANDLRMAARTAGVELDKVGFGSLDTRRARLDEGAFRAAVEAANAPARDLERRLEDLRQQVDPQGARDTAAARERLTLEQQRAANQAKEAADAETRGASLAGEANRQRQQIRERYQQLLAAIEANYNAETGRPIDPRGPRFIGRGPFAVDQRGRPVVFTDIPFGDSSERGVKEIREADIQLARQFQAAVEATREQVRQIREVTAAERDYARERRASVERIIASGRRAYGQTLTDRLAEGTAVPIGQGLYLDTELRRFAQRTAEGARVIDRIADPNLAQRIHTGMRRLAEAAEREAREMETQPGAAGGGARPPGGGGFLSGFLGGFSSRGFGRGARGFQAEFMENIGSTIGAEARFLASYQVLLGLRRVVSDLTREYMSYASAVTDLEVATGDSTVVTQELRQALGDIASEVGEGASAAMESAARGVRAYADVAGGSVDEIRDIATAFAETTQALSLLTNQSLLESTNEAVAIGQAYGLTANNLSLINEAIVEAKALGGYPDEISTGLANVAVAAEDAGLSVREAAGVISAAIAQTGQSGQAVATRLSRVFNTLRGTTGRTLLSGLGIDVGQQPIDQLRDLADIWETLGDLDQRRVASQLSGVANVREFTVLLDQMRDGSRLQQVIERGFEQGGQAAAEYDRIINSTAGQLRQLIGQFRELQQGLIEAGALDFLGALIVGVQPFLQAANDILDIFNDLPRPVRTAIAVLLELYGVYRLVSALRAQAAAQTAAEVGAEATATAAKVQSTSATSRLIAAQEALNAARVRSVADLNLETAATEANTAAKMANAAAAETSAGATAAGGAAAGGAAAGGGAAAAAGWGRWLRVGFALLIFTTLKDIADTFNDAFEASTTAMAEAQRSVAEGTAEDVRQAVDILRNTAEESRRAGSGGFLGIRTALNWIDTIAPWVESTTERADRLDEQADWLADVVLPRREEIESRAQAVAQAGGVFGATLDGVEELQQGLSVLSDSGASAVTVITAINDALERTISIGRMADEDLTVLPGQLERLADQLAADIVALRDRAVRMVLEVDDDEPTTYREQQQRLREEQMRREGYFPLSKDRVDFEDLGFDPDTLADQLFGPDSPHALSDEQIRQLNEDVYEAALSALRAHGVTLEGGGVLTDDQLREIAEQIAATYVPEGMSEDEAERVRRFFTDQITEYLRESLDITARELTQAEANAIAAAVAAQAEGFEQIERLRGATELEAAQARLRELERTQRLLQGVPIMPEVLEIAILEAIRNLEDIQDAVDNARRALMAAEQPPEDVIGHQTMEMVGLQAALRRARERGDQRAELEVQAQIVELRREMADAIVEQQIALLEAAVDPRDTIGQAQAQLQAAIMRLERIQQFDSAGVQTAEYSNAYRAYLEAQQALIQEAINVADLARRAALDPRDRIGDARADLELAQAQLNAALADTEGYYEAQRRIREAQQELARLEVERANAAERASVAIGDTVGQAVADLNAARRELSLQLANTAEYYDALRAVREAERALAEALIAESEAMALTQVPVGDTLGEARVHLQAAERRLALATPGTLEYWTLLRQVQELRHQIAQEERATADAMLLASVDPRDELGQARVQLQIAQRALAAAIPGTREYYEALRAVNEAQVNLARVHQETAAARRLAQIDPRDTIANAEAQVQNIQEALANAIVGTREYYELQRQLAEAQQDLLDEQRRLADAIDEAAVAPGDEVGAAEARLRAAQRALAAALPGTIAYYEALAAVAEAERALADARRALADAMTMAMVFPGSDLDQARAQLEIAQRALADAERGTREYYEALAAVKQAQVALARAEVQARSVRFQLGIDLTNPIQAAYARLRELEDLFRTLSMLGAPRDVLDSILLQIEQAESALEATRFNERLSTLQKLVDIGAITEEQYRQYLEAEKARLLAIQDRTYQQNQQLIQIEQALQAMSEGMAGQFNLGEIRTPTPFEVRRAIARAMPGLTEMEDAFGTGSSRDPVGILVTGSIEAVNNLATAVEDFGNLVPSILSQIGLSLVDGQIVPSSQAASVGSTTAPAPAPFINVVGQQGLQIPLSPTLMTPMGGGQMTWHQNINVQIDGADFAQVRAYFDRLLGGAPMGSRSVATTRKV